MKPTPAQRTTFLYDTFLKASQEPDRRPAGATEAELYAHMEGWKDGLFVDSVQKTLQMHQLKQATPKRSLTQRLLSPRP